MAFTLAVAAFALVIIGSYLLSGNTHRRVAPLAEADGLRLPVLDDTLFLSFFGTPDAPQRIAEPVGVLVPQPAVATLEPRPARAPRPHRHAA